MKIYPLLLLVLLAPRDCVAQEKNNTACGLKAGLNHTRLFGRDSNGDKLGYSGTEIYGSFFLETGRRHTTYLGTELIFSYTESYHFIEVPLQLKQVLTRRLTAFAGPKLDYFLDKHFENDPLSRVKSLGISVDAGLQFTLLKCLFTECRYSTGLTRQINDYGFDINHARRSTLRLGLGLYL